MQTVYVSLQETTRKHCSDELRKFIEVNIKQAVRVGELMRLAVVKKVIKFVFDKVTFAEAYLRERPEKLTSRAGEVEEHKPLLLTPHPLPTTGGALHSKMMIGTRCATPSMEASSQKVWHEMHEKCGGGSVKTLWSGDSVTEVSMEDKVENRQSQERAVGGGHESRLPLCAPSSEKGGSCRGDTSCTGSAFLFSSVKWSLVNCLRLEMRSVCFDGSVPAK